MSDEDARPDLDLYFALLILSHFLKYPMKMK